MSLDYYALYLLLALGTVLSPGPAVIYTIGNTLTRGSRHAIAGFVHLMKELKFKNKKAATFGCYGWSGESTKVLNEWLTEAGFETINEGLRNQWNPDSDQQESAIAFGKIIAKA